MFSVAFAFFTASLYPRLILLMACCWIRDPGCPRLGRRDSGVLDLQLSNATRDKEVASFNAAGPGS